MAQQELTLGYSRAYFKDRVKELRNQLPNGDPFVFIGAFVVLNSIAIHAGRSVEQVLPNEYDPIVKGGIALMMNHISKFYAIFCDGSPENPATLRHKLTFTHDDSAHLLTLSSDDGTMIKHVLSAGKFLDTVDQVIDSLFDEAKDNKMLALKLYLNINERRLFGHGK